MITTHYPDVGDRDSFSVMQACRTLGICRGSLQKYTEEGLIKYRLNARGKKTYSGKALKNFYEKMNNI